ncbi:MAG: DUF6754 domain-containing protein [Bacillota bacterium]
MVEGRVASFILLVMTAVAVYLSVQRARSGILPELRKIAAFDAIEEAVGRATELGRPVLFTPGKGDITDIGGPQVLAGLDMLSYVSQLTARYKAGLVATIPVPTVQPIAEDVIHTSYIREGQSDAYSPDMVRFVSPEQMAYATGTAGVVMREQVAATFLVGPFYGESLIIAESAAQLGAIQIAGTARMVQIPFFVGACDYALIGEEMYATSAYLTGDPVQLGIIHGQDTVRAITILLIVIGSLLTTVGVDSLTTLIRM